MSEKPGSDPSEEAERTVGDLEDQSDKLEEQIEDTRSDWESKRESSDVPGAVPDEADWGDEDG